MLSNQCPKDNRIPSKELRTFLIAKTSNPHKTKDNPKSCYQVLIW